MKTFHETQPECGQGSKPLFNTKSMRILDHIPKHKFGFRDFLVARHASTLRCLYKYL